MQKQLENNINNFIETAEDLGTDLDVFKKSEDIAKKLKNKIGKNELLVGLISEPRRGKNAIIDLLTPHLNLDMHIEKITLVQDIQIYKDVWILVLAAEQLGSLMEKEFIKNLGSIAAGQVIILVNHINMIPENKVDDILDYARSLFLPYGVPAENILPFQTELTPKDMREKIINFLNGWAAETTQIREKILRQIFKEVYDDLLKENKTTRTFLNQTKDPFLAEQDIGEFNKSIEIIADAFKLSLDDEIEEQISNNFKEQWDSWIRDMSVTAPEQIKILENRLKEWINVQLVKEFKNGINIVIQKLVKDMPSMSDILSETEKMISDLSLKPDITVEIKIMADVSTEDKPDSAIIIRLVLCLAGAGIGLVRLGMAGALIGIPLGMIISEAIIKNTSAKDKGNDSHDFSAFESDIQNQIPAFCNDAVKKILEQFYDTARKKQFSLRREAEQAKESAGERESASVKLKTLGNLIEIVKKIKGSNN